MGNIKSKTHTLYQEQSKESEPIQEELKEFQYKNYIEYENSGEFEHSEEFKYSEICKNNISYLGKDYNFVYNVDDNTCDNSIISFKFGIIKLNENYIPNIIVKEKWTNKKGYLKGNIYINTPIKLNVEIGGSLYIFKKGSYFIPNMCNFHNIKILTDISNNNKIEIYDCCFTDDYYNESFKLAIKYKIITNTITKLDNKKFSDDVAIFGSGMCGNNSESYFSSNYYLNNSQFILSSECIWFNKTKLISRDRIKINTYSQFLHHLNVKLIQNDDDITCLLEYYDKDFVRESYPPCILITYSEQNFEKLKEVLKTKYDKDICMPKEPDKLFEKKTYNEIIDEIKIENEKLEKYEKAGIFKFIQLKKMPFTKNCYDHIYENFNENYKKYLY